MSETPEKETKIDTPPKLDTRAPSGRVTVTLVSLAALVVVGAATANFLPNLERIPLPSIDTAALPKFDDLLPNLESISLPSLDSISLPKFDYSFLPTFHRIASPNSARAVAQPPPTPPPVPQPDFIARAALRDIQLSQEQNAAVLASLTQNSASLQSDLKRISRQLSTLSVQVEGLRGSLAPLTTSSIPHSNPRARIIRAARAAAPAPPPPAPSPPLPKPVGPVSIGGAPLSLPPASGV